MQYESKDLETLYHEMMERYEKKHPLVFIDDDDGVITEKRLGDKIEWETKTGR